MYCTVQYNTCTVDYHPLTVQSNSLAPFTSAAQAALNLTTCCTIRVIFRGLDCKQIQRKQHQR